MFKLIKLNYVRSCIHIPNNSYASPSGKLYFTCNLYYLLDKGTLFQN